MSDSRTDIVVDLPGGARYPIRFSPLSDLPPALEAIGLGSERVVVVTDEHVAPLYGDKLVHRLSRGGRMVHRVVLPAGEPTKSLDHLGRVYDAVLGAGIDRATPVVALGGGVVGDLAGFAASTLLRGVPLVHVPTTLVAQVDSAIGGKTGINHPTGKNLVGSFYQPRLVWTDVATLSTLPPREWNGGLAEVVKHALIGDSGLLDMLEPVMDRFVGGDPDVLEPVIRQAIAVKVGIVEADERETGVRMFLNFGHTFAHALELTAGYGALTHGEAVAMGMQAALFLSARRRPSISFERARSLLDRLPPVRPPDGLDVDDLVAAMHTDKKVLAGTIRLVLLEAVGRPEVVDDVDAGEIERAWRHLLAH